jgi:hypothetical protein
VFSSLYLHVVSVDICRNIQLHRLDDLTQHSYSAPSNNAVYLSTVVLVTSRDSYFTARDYLPLLNVKQKKTASKYADLLSSSVAKGTET